MRTLFCCLCLSSLLIGEEISLQEEVREVPVNFLHDVMKPIGVPAVSFYHAIRESLFLNMRITHANPLEATGDFFLIPSRYLFAGKKVHFREHGYNIEQSYRYRKLHWPKVIGSAIALPVSYTAGALFKGLSYLFPEVRRRHRQIRRTLNAHPIQPHGETYKAQGIAEMYSNEAIPCKHLDRPSGLTQKQRAEIHALQEVATLLDQHQIPYWIDCGTCLGAYRYGGIIPWDWDIDLAILLDDHDNVKNALSLLDPKKYQIQDWSSYSKPKTFLKLYVKETHNFIDIYHYKINEEEETVGYLYTYIDSPFPYEWKKSELKCTTPLPLNAVFPLKKAAFDQLTVWAPHDVVTFLQSKYGENLDPTMVWNAEEKRYDKVEDHPYYQ